MPVPTLAWYVLAATSALAAGLALSASTTCLDVLLSAPVASVARLTTMSLVGIVISEMPLLASASLGSYVRHVPSVTVIDSGALLVPAAGGLNSAVGLLPPGGPMGLGTREIAGGARAAGGVPLPAVPAAIIAMPGRW